MNKRKYNWLILGLLVVIGLAIMGLLRTCKSVKNNPQINLSERVKKLLDDSVKNAINEDVYQHTIEYQDGQLALSDNKIASLTISLDSANDRISALIKKYKIKWSALTNGAENTDTSMTMVPGAFVADCSSCFQELEKGQQSVLKYKAEKDNQEYLFKTQIKTKDSRINNLELINKGITSSYRSLLDSTKKINSSPVRRTLYFKLGMLAINQTFPNSAGMGLLYQDKMKRMFGVGLYVSPFGSIYSADIAFPLSLKRK